MIQEEHEIFGDVTRSPLLIVVEADADAELDAYLKRLQGLLFVETRISLNPVRNPLSRSRRGGRLVVLTAEVESILQLTPPVGDQCPLESISGGSLFSRLTDFGFALLSDGFSIREC